MDERHAARGRPARHRVRRLGIDAEGEIALVLGAVDRRVGRRIDDEIGRQRIERGRDRLRLGEVEPGAVRRHHGAEAAEHGQERRADLSGNAGEQDAHQTSP